MLVLISLIQRMETIPKSRFRFICIAGYKALSKDKTWNLALKLEDTRSENSQFVHG